MIEKNEGLRISQAMIVKNEEKNIRRALSWGKGIVSEQIVVDTGSTDDTVKIAEDLGAKVLHFTWIDDFSAAKNYAIDQCKGDWIAFLDADEFFKDDTSKILDIIKKAEQNRSYVIAVQLINLNDEGEIIGGMTQARIFKNHVGIYYKGSIHEYLCSDDKINIYDATNELMIFHTGYSDSSYKSTNKTERNKSMLEKELQLHPDNSDYYGHLGDIYAGEGDYDKAEELYFTAIKFMDNAISDESLRRGTTLRNLLVILGGYNYRTDDLLKVYNYASTILPHDADFPCLVADHYYRYCNFKEAAKFYKKALDIYNKYGAYLKSDYVDTNLALIYSNLANSYFLIKDYISSIKTAVVVMTADKYNTDILKILLLSIKEINDSGIKGYGLKDEITLLSKFYDVNTLKDKALIYMMAEKLDIIDLMKYIADISSENEMKIIKSLN